MGNLEQDFHENRANRVQDWLDQNVRVYPEPKSVTLTDFSVDWERFSGEFKVTMEPTALPEVFTFGLEASGRTTLYMPMFHSPLGVPCSYPAIKITQKTRTAILTGLHHTIPRIAAAGLDKRTGKEVTFHTPPIERIDPDVLARAKEKVVDGYTFTVMVKQG